MATVYYRQGQYSEALEAYQRALSVYKTLNNQVEIGTTLNHIGEVYERLGNYPQALQTWKEALAILQQTGNQKAIQETQRSIDSLQKKQQGGV